MAGKQTVGEALKLAQRRVLVKDAVALIGELHKQPVKSGSRKGKRAAANPTKTALLNDVKAVVSMRKMAKEAHDAAKKELTRVAVQYTMAKRSHDVNFKKRAAVELARTLTLEKAALVGRLGAGMMRLGGGASRALGLALRRAGLRSSGRMLGGAGKGLQRMGQLGGELSRMSGAAGGKGALAQLLKNPELSRALGVSEMAGMGGIGAGAYGLLSALSGTGASPEKGVAAPALPPTATEEYPQ